MVRSALPAVNRCSPATSHPIVSPFRRAHISNMRRRGQTQTRVLATVLFTDYRRLHGVAVVFGSVWATDSNDDEVLRVDPATA